MPVQYTIYKASISGAQYHCSFVIQLVLKVSLQIYRDINISFFIDVELLNQVHVCVLFWIPRLVVLFSSIDKGECVLLFWKKSLLFIKTQTIQSATVTVAQLFEKCWIYHTGIIFGSRMPCLFFDYKKRPGRMLARWCTLGHRDKGPAEKIRERIII